jgi:tetratricopeptide (TPR) repeat protein
MIGGENFAFSPDSQLLAVETGLGVVRLVATATGRDLARLENPDQARARDLTFNADGSKLVANADNECLHVWDLRTLRDQLAQRGLDWDQAPYPPADLLPAAGQVEWYVDGRERGKACARSGQWADAAAWYTRTLEMTPDDQEARLGRAYAYAVLAAWEKVSAEFPEWENPSAPLHTTFMAACLNLLQGDTRGYQRLCRRFLEGPGPIKVLLGDDFGATAARACTLSRDPVVKPAQAVLWAEAAVARQVRPWYVHGVALAHFRAGHRDLAITRCRQSLEAGASWDGRAVNWLLLGMALQRKGQNDEARQWLDRAQKWHAAVLAGQRPEASPPDMPLADWLEFQVLFREAEALRPQPATDQTRKHQ